MFTWAGILALFGKFGGLLVGGVGALFGNTTSSKITLIVVLAAAGFMGFKLYTWDVAKKAEIAALQKFNNQQQQQILKDKDRELAELKKLHDLELSVLRQNTKDLEQINSKYLKLQTELKKIQGDRAASEILKKTIEGLNKQ